MLKKDEQDKKQQLEKSIVDGVESGKRGFQQAAQALLKIDELSLWRDEAVDFNTYRQKFKAMLEDLDITDRHLNRLIAAEKCVQVLRPRGLNISQYMERQIRPLTRLDQPQQVELAYKRAMEIAQSKGEEPKARHFEAAVAEIKPPKVKPRKPPRIPIGSMVQILPHYADEELHGATGIIVQQPSHDRCIIRFDAQTSKLIPDGFLAVVKSVKEITSVQQEQKEMARDLGLRTGLQALPDIELKEINISSEEAEMAIAIFLRMLPKFSHQQKVLVYEQLIKSGLNLEVAA